MEVDLTGAVEIAKKLSKEPAKGRLSSAITTVMVKSGDESAYDFIANSFDKMPLSQAKFQALQPFAELLAKVKDAAKFKSGIDMIAKFRDAIPESVKAQTNPFINGVILKGIADKKDKAGEKELADYARGKIS